MPYVSVVNEPDGLSLEFHDRVDEAWRDVIARSVEVDDLDDETKENIELCIAQGTFEDLEYILLDNGARLFKVEEIPE